MCVSALRMQSSQKLWPHGVRLGFFSPSQQIGQRSASAVAAAEARVVIESASKPHTCTERGFSEQGCLPRLCLPLPAAARGVRTGFA